MRKRTKDALETIVLIIIVLLIPLIFLLLEFTNNLNSFSKTKKELEYETNNTLNNLYTQITQSPKNEDSSNVRNRIIDIFEHMNSKDFKYLYDLLNTNLKENMFPTYEIFSNYMIKYTNGLFFSPQIKVYQKAKINKENVFILDVNFIEKNTKTEINKKILKTDTFVIHEYPDGNYDFSFLGYIGCGKSEKDFYKNDKFTCTLLGTDLFMDHTIFNIKINNLSDKDLFINKNDIFVVTGSFPKRYPSYILIPPKSTHEFYFTIYTGFNLKTTLPTKIRFNGINSDGKVYLFNLPITYPIKFNKWF